MPVVNAWRNVVRSHRLQQRLSQLPFIFRPQSKRGLKDPGFMLPIFMRGAQAIPTELTGIKVRMFRVRQLHLPVLSTIPIARRAHTSRPDRTRSLPNRDFKSGDVDLGV